MQGQRSHSKPTVYKFVHRTDEYIQTSIKGLTYKQKDGWLEIDETGKLYLNTSCGNGYAWDGCTPKFIFLDFVFGTPDGKLDYATEKPITYYASMAHDMLYQFKSDIPLSRKDSDVLFLRILQQADFKWTWVYYFFVRVFGWIFKGWKTKKNSNNITIETCSWLERAKEELHKMNLPVGLEHPLL